MTRNLLKIEVKNTTHGVSDSVELGWGSKICILKKKKKTVEVILLPNQIWEPVVYNKSLWDVRHSDFRKGIVVDDV